MPKKSPPPAPLDLSAFDAVLAGVVGSGWNESPEAVPPDAGFPPLPVKTEGHGAVMPSPQDPEGSEAPVAHRVMDIGLLADFVTGQRSAQDTAQAAGVTINELHSALATTLAQVDPRELAKAMGLQVAATQLKAGAVFNALLADLLEDIRSNRVKADTKIELMKLLSRIGRLEPKEEKASAGTGFQVVIDMGGTRLAPPPVTVIEI